MTDSVTFTRAEAEAIRAALDACSESVGALRRGHGQEVTQLALIGSNALVETDAQAIMARKGYVGGGYDPEWVIEHD